jgi:hypothetical protein
MLGPEYDSESKGLLDELLAVPSSESEGGGSLQRISAKRVAGRGPEAKTSKGFGKGMGMELGSLSGGKVEGPKAGVGSDMLELARQYKLKAKRAEDTARGLMRGTLGEPTLEQPTLMRGPLVRRRFQKGGEVLSSPEEQPVTEESSASKMLKRLVEPVREGAKGYFGFEPTEPLNPTQPYQTGQALANMPGAGAPAALGIFIGRGARGWNKAANAVAQKMAKQGATPDEIWQQTGNFKAPDGKWRQEISDQAAQHRGQVSRGPAGMVFKHPELYENYPELRDILVRTNPYETKSALTAGGQPGAVIELGTAGGRTENARGMLHELQHDIQFREGFGLGGSELTAFTDPRAHEILKELRAKMAQPASLQEFARDAWKTDKITPEVKQSYQDYLGFRKTNAKNLDIEAQKTAARLYYERLLGEAESRAVEARQFLTPEERRLVLPSQSYKMDGGREIIPLEKLIIKRAEGGDVSRETSESRSYLDELNAQDDPIRSGRPLQSRTRKRSTPEQNEALNRAALQGVANMPYNLVGAPVDLLNMLLTPAGLGSEKPVMGSDWIKQKMTDVGVRPEPPTDPTQRALYSAADFASNFVNPAAPVRAAAKGAEKTGEAAQMLAEDFQKYNRALGPAGASHVIKPKGGSWFQANVDRELDSIKRTDRYGMKSPEQTAKALGTSVDEARKLWDPGDLALNTWIDRNLGNYIKRELASPKDSLRELAESGISVAPLARAEYVDTYPWLARERPAAGFPAEGMARGPVAKALENLGDSLVSTKRADELPEDTLARQPGLRNLPPDETVYGLTSDTLSGLGFDHVVDVLRGDIQAGRLDPKRLDNLSVEQAVRRTDQFDKMMAKRQQQARIKAASDLPVVKQYDEGYRWLELKPKLADDWKPPENVEIVKPTPSSQTWAIWDKNTASYVTTGLGSPEAAQKHLRDMALEKRTQEVLKQEGDVMGHCIGDYCSDVMAGKSQHFSLRDAKGEQHVTIDVRPSPQTRSDLVRHVGSEEKAEDFLVKAFQDRNSGLTEKSVLGRALELAGVPLKQEIRQIKGKGNVKPKEEYLPFVQDFIKSSNWSEIKDVKNAGLRRYTDVFNVAEQRKIEALDRPVPDHGWLTGDQIQELHNAIVPAGQRLKYDAYGNIVGENFAQGGPVNASTARAQLDRLMAA